MNCSIASNNEFIQTTSNSPSPENSPLQTSFNFTSIQEAEEAEENPTEMKTILSTASSRINVPRLGNAQSNKQKLLVKLARERAEDRKWERFNSSFEVELNLSNEELGRKS